MENQNDPIEQEIAEAIEKPPEVMSKIASELSIWMGSMATWSDKDIDLDKIADDARKAASELKRLDAMRDEPLTNRKISKTLTSLETFASSAMGYTSEDQTAMAYIFQEIRKLTEVPSELEIPDELDYESKHCGLWHFIVDLVETIDEQTLNTFIYEPIAGRQLISQIQKIFNERPLPSGLVKRPQRATYISAENLKRAFQEVANDWDALLNLLYGLLLLSRGKECPWPEVKKHPLRTKASIISTDTRLESLVNDDWVTVRNALAHGSGYLNSITRTVDFRDRAREVLWSLPRLYLEGFDVFLSSLAILYTWHFVHGARMQVFEGQIGLLRSRVGKR